MGYFDTLQQKMQTISLERPCQYTGEEILNVSSATLHKLIDKELSTGLTEEEGLQKQWLSRLAKVICRENIYLCSIDEAVRIGLLI